jgi:hypothetical protein
MRERNPVDLYIITIKVLEDVREQTLPNLIAVR